jgi:hypothetical protein
MGKTVRAEVDTRQTTPAVITPGASSEAIRRQGTATMKLAIPIVQSVAKFTAGTRF